MTVTAAGVTHVTSIAATTGKAANRTAVQTGSNTKIGTADKRFTYAAKTNTEAGGCRIIDTGTACPHTAKALNGVLTIGFVQIGANTGASRVDRAAILECTFTGFAGHTGRAGTIGHTFATRRQETITAGTDAPIGTNLPLTTGNSFAARFIAIIFAAYTGSRPVVPSYGHTSRTPATMRRGSGTGSLILSGIANGIAASTAGISSGAAGYHTITAITDFTKVFIAQKETVTFRFFHATGLFYTTGGTDGQLLAFFGKNLAIVIAFATEFNTGTFITGGSFITTAIWIELATKRCCTMTFNTHPAVKTAILPPTIDISRTISLG